MHRRSVIRIIATAGRSSDHRDSVICTLCTSTEMNIAIVEKALRLHPDSLVSSRVTVESCENGAREISCRLTHHQSLRCIVGREARQPTSEANRQQQARSIRIDQTEQWSIGRGKKTARRIRREKQATVTKHRTLTQKKQATRGRTTTKQKTKKKRIWRQAQDTNSNCINHTLG